MSLTWPGATITILASGPSLTFPGDLEALRIAQLAGLTRVLAISDAIHVFPDADVLFAPDARWWGRQTVLPHHSQKFTLQHTGFPSVTTLDWRQTAPLDPDRHYLATGGHAGYAAINLAAHLVGPGTIILLGYDMQPGSLGQHHYFGDHVDGTHVRYERWLPLYQDIPAQLAALGCLIVNATRTSAVPCIARMPLSHALVAEQATR